MIDKEDSGGGKQVIARAASILRALENQRSGLSLSQLSNASGLPRTTVHRIVAALEAQQMVSTGSTGIRLGPALVRLAASAHTDVVAVARPYVEALGRRTRETVDVSVYRGFHAISVDQYPSDQELRVVSAVGTAFPVHCTAHGKALLGTFSDEDLVRMHAEPFERRTPSTLVTLDEVLKDVSICRERSWAVDVEEHAQGVCGIGVHLQTSLSERYAISLAVPALRFHEKVDDLKAALLQCKAEVESVIGL